MLSFFGIKRQDPCRDADHGVCSSKENIQKRALTFDYGNVKVRGVNIGGWLVLERKLCVGRFFIVFISDLTVYRDSLDYSFYL